MAAILPNRSAAALGGQHGGSLPARHGPQRPRCVRASAVLSTSSPPTGSARAAAAVAAAALVLWGGGSPPHASAAAAATAVATTQPGENVGYFTNGEVDAKRQAKHFRRAYDGHVAVQDKSTREWWDVKCDLQSPGTLLLRNPSGQVWAIAYGGLKQVDLSDDEVVAAIASDTWERDASAVQAEDERGGVSKLELTREVFYQLLSLQEGGSEEEGGAQ